MGSCPAAKVLAKEKEVGAVVDPLLQALPWIVGGLLLVLLLAVLRRPLGSCGWPPGPGWGWGCSTS